MPEQSHTAACFIRVDVNLSGGPSSDAYDAISERLQNLLQEAILQKADGGPEIDLQAMTCLVLGPLDEADTIASGIEQEDHFAPVGEWLSDAGKEDDDQLPPRVTAHSRH